MERKLKCTAELSYGKYIKVDKVLLELVDERETCYQVKIKKQQATKLHLVKLTDLETPVST